MNHLDYIIIGSFLLITLIIGLRASKGIKSIREYAIANKMYGTGILTMTLLATYFAGGNVIGKQKVLLKYGLIAGMPVLGTSIMFICIGLWIVPKMLRFKDCITIGDIMKNLYGQSGELITGILGFIFTICIVGAQIIAMGNICEGMLGWPKSWGILMGGSILILYASIGGIKSVTLTDVFQFLVFIIIIPLLANIALSKVGGIQGLFQKLPQEKLNVSNHNVFYPYLLTFIFWALFPITFFYPAIIQRTLMAKTKKQAQNMFFVSATIILIIRVLIILTCFAVFILAPDIKPSAGGAFLYIMKEYLSPTLYYFCVAGMFAIVMSTVDSVINSGGILLTHNFIKPLLDKKKIKFNELKFVRYITFAIGIFSIMTALGMVEDQSIGLRALAYLGICIFMPVVTLPMIMGILGLKTDKKIFLTAAFITISTFIIARLSITDAGNYIKAGYLLLPITIITNAIVFLGMHYYKNKGFHMISIDDKKSDDKLYRISLQAILSFFLKIIPTPKRITNYCQNQYKKYGASPTLFAFFMLFNYAIPLFMHKTHDTYVYTGLFFLKGLGALLCIGMFFKHYIPNKLTKYFPTYYYFTVLYCLPFTTTFLFVLGECNIEWIINIALSIMFLIILTDWVTFFILAFLGIFLAIISYQYWIGTPAIIQDSDTLYTLIYTILFSTTIGLFFARRKQKTYDDITLSNQYLQEKDQENTQELLFSFKEKIGIIKTLQQANIKKLPEIAKMIKSLRGQKNDPVKMDNTLDKLEDTLIPMAVKLERIENRSLDYLQLDVKSTNIQSILDQLKAKTQKQNITITYHINTKEKCITCDPKYIHQLLNNAITLLTSNNKNDIIYIDIQETQLSYPLASVGKDYKKNIKALGFVLTTKNTTPNLDTTYMAALEHDKLPMSDNMSMLLLHNNQRIIKAHYGYTDVCKPIQSTHLYVIPLNLNEVRPKSMNDNQMQLGGTLVKANDHYPGAQKQEKSLLKSISAKSKADLKKVKNALEIIKYYHGLEKRKSGEPFYLHPIAVAEIVLDYNQDEATILAALLHDTVEDTAMLLENIEMLFGQSVANLVDRLTHLESKKDVFSKISLAKFENISTLLDVKDERVLYIKLADRLHNMRTLYAKSWESQQKKANETLNFFVPLAKYLKLENAAQELKGKSLEILKYKT